MCDFTAIAENIPLMHIKKKWAKKNLTNGYDLDFRSEREKELDSMSDFKKAYVLAGCL